MISLDIRGLSVASVAAAIESGGMNAIGGACASSDVTGLWGPLEGYMRVFCVWLNDKLSNAAEFILWDGRIVRPTPGQDLHGFVRIDGKIDWGIATTINLMN